MPMSEEGGYTLVELLIGAMISLVVLGAIMMMVEVATRGQDRVTERVYANQRGRPVMNRLVDRLHAACVSPGLAPVLKESDDDTLILYSQAGSDVSPVPDRYVIDLSGGALTETVYPGTGGEPEEWTFGSPSGPAQVLDGVGGAEVGEPPVPVPLFRYFAYEEGEVASTPLETPLDEEDAKQTVQVDIAFTVAPSSAGSAYDNSEVTLSDSATLRIEPASEDSAEVNLPCE